MSSGLTAATAFARGAAAPPSSAATRTNGRRRCELGIEGNALYSNPASASEISPQHEGQRVGMDRHDAGKQKHAGTRRGSNVAGEWNRPRGEQDRHIQSDEIAAVEVANHDEIRHGIGRE